MTFIMFLKAGEITLDDVSGMSLNSPSKKEFTVNKCALLFMTFLSLSFSSFAAERLDSSAALSHQVQGVSAPDWSVTVTGQGQLAAKPGPVFTEGGNYAGMMLPYLESTPKPISYPRWAIRQGWEGRFVIAIEVLLDGTVGRYKVMESSGHSLLDATAVKAVKSWKFHPAMKEGNPTVTCIEVPVIFQLSKD